MTNFTKGDRVELNQDHEGYEKGDTGVVTRVDSGMFLRGLDVKMDKDGKEVFMFIERWNKKPARKFSVGQRVTITGRPFPQHRGVEELVVIALREDGYGVGPKGNADLPHNNREGWLFYLESELKAYTPPAPQTAAERLGLKVGQKVRITDNARGSVVRFKGKTGTVASSSASLIRVDIDGANRAFYSDEVEAYVEPKTAAAKAGYKAGDKVRPANPEGSFVTASFKANGGVIAEKQTPNSDLIQVNVNDSGRRDYYLPTEIEAGEVVVEPAFKIGDYVEVTKANSTFTGTKGWVVVSPYKDSYIHINLTDKAGKAQYRFAPSQLIAAEEPFVPKFKAGDYAKIAVNTYGDYSGKVFEVRAGEKAAKHSLVELNLIDPKDSEHKWVGHFNASVLEKAEKPWAPKFKKGDWVEVTKEHNTVWAGIGQIESEATKGWSDVIVKLVTGGQAGSTGGFAESKLIAASEPARFKVGDYVEVVANPVHSYNSYAGTKGWIVESPAGETTRLHVSPTKGGTSWYRFEPVDLQAAEEPKPFAIGDRVEQKGFGLGSMDGIIGVVTGFEPNEWDGAKLWVTIDATESNSGKFRRFPAENLTKLPKRELPAKAGKVIHVTKYDGKPVDLHAMFDGTDDYDPWFAPTPGDGDNWLSAERIEQWSEVKVTSVS